ncbi:dehydrodolichyl diphosphate synthase complex subunit DHDDS [Belonocnema kinseyi]|uniref:dehydrodolichyl diphosphate synthase complex subunit DHDDS n=1 Tax=Belonocnema kinseyi TaxID=2817044 RepID=UPI00143D32CE|nr:dehydrodolichyl diphosphate synthase complex subunit DHDDS [Belonocnema kinseyi]XP_033210270.1 dehydrodolichyl diphosphate synthase complex subunit DHDDS [Belonocnema kinseyi]XP_033210271.1 dehydrodolichyl diphosphate synthase complex subunit DHDDS [Belonocnema kinseyi]XP_033210272.1 dehydrodolichyl diphosphate synthase complex subunit DHDDS [Belonocnema kinseyi]
MSWIRDSTLNWIQRLAVKIVKSGQIPRHVAFIMDGNRRYANKKNVEKVEGHTQGFYKLTETLQWCLELGVPEVTVYAFSIENFKRSKEEVDGLMDLARKKFQGLLDERDKLMENGVCIRVVGNLSLIPEDVQKLIAEAMIITKDNSKAVLNLAFSYTSRDEITQAVKDVVDGVKSTELLVEDINEDLINDCLYTHKSPEPDLLIRTSGEIRLSDFLLWQITSTCIYFAEVLWPEFTVWDLLAAVLYYQRCTYDLRLVAKKVESKHLICNNRITSYICNVYKQRQMFIENISQTAVQ